MWCVGVGVGSRTSPVVGGGGTGDLLGGTSCSRTWCFVLVLSVPVLGVGGPVGCGGGTLLGPETTHRRRFGWWVCF